jgi:hypothetical protein
MSDIEGKAASVAAIECGQRASFKAVAPLLCSVRCARASPAIDAMTIITTTACEKIRACRAVRSFYQKLAQSLLAVASGRRKQN